MKKLMPVVALAAVLLSSCAGLKAREDLMPAIRIGWTLVMNEIGDSPEMQEPEVLAARRAFEEVLRAGVPADLRSVALPVLEAAARAAIDSRVDNPDLRVLLHALLDELRLSVVEAIGR